MRERTEVRVKLSPHNHCTMEKGLYLLSMRERIEVRGKVSPNYHYT